MADNKDFKDAILKNRNGDLSKRWYVEFYCYNSNTDKLQRYTHYIPSKYKTAAQRQKYGKELIIEINYRLRQGYVPDNSLVEPELINNKETAENTTKISKIILLVFDEAVKILKASQKKGKSQGKFETVNNVFKDFVKKYSLEELEISQFSTYHSQLYSNYLINDRNNTNLTRNNMYGYMKRIFGYFIRLKYISENPFNEEKYRERPSVSNLAFSIEQKNSIEKYLLERNVRLFLYTRFLYYLATRTEESIKLKVGDVNFAKQTITLWEETSKSSEMITHPIPEPLFEYMLIEMKLNTYPSNYFIFGKNLETSQFPAGRNYAYNHHKAALEKLGIYDKDKPRKYTLYSWKGTGSDQAISQNPDMDILEVMHHLRHKNLATTQTYVKARGLKVNEAMKKRRW